MMYKNIRYNVFICEYVTKFNYQDVIKLLHTFSKHIELYLVNGVLKKREGGLMH